MRLCSKNQKWHLAIWHRPSPTIKTIFSMGLNEGGNYITGYITLAYQKPLAVTTRSWFLLARVWVKKLGCLNINLEGPA